MTPEEAEQQAKTALNGRQRSYQATFNTEAMPAVEVLADLAKFCRAHKSTFHENPQVANQLDGRREVWLRIQEHLQLSSQELWLLYSGRR